VHNDFRVLTSFCLQWFLATLKRNRKAGKSLHHPLYDVLQISTHCIESLLSACRTRPRDDRYLPYSLSTHSQDFFSPEQPLAPKALYSALNLGGTHRGPRHDPRTKLLESHASPKVIGVQKALALLWFSELLRSVAQRSSGSGVGRRGSATRRARNWRTCLWGEGALVGADFWSRVRLG
jgi:hypothetical protein